jgi:hypothetical protein
MFLVHRLQDAKVDWSHIGVVVHDIKIPTSGFVSVSFKHIYGKSNIWAHTLARFAELLVSALFRNSTPDYIR